MGDPPLKGARDVIASLSAFIAPCHVIEPSRSYICNLAEPFQELHSAGRSILCIVSSLRVHGSSRGCHREYIYDRYLSFPLGTGLGIETVPWDGTAPSFQV